MGEYHNDEKWKTNKEAPTETQQEYLAELGREAGEEVNLHLSKEEARRKIKQLRQKTGREIK